MNTSNLKMPSPGELAKKESTRTLSLRIKEKTLLAFEKYGQQNGVTASSLINNVLDYYVEMQESSNTMSEEESRAVSAKVLGQYMEKLAGRVGKASDEDLLAQFSRADAQFLNVFNDDDRKGLFESTKRELRNNEIDEGLGSFWIGDIYNTDFSMNNIKKADVDIDDISESRTFCVPIKQFPIFAALVIPYCEKIAPLFGVKRGDLKISESTFDELTKISAEGCKDRVEFAKKIAKALADDDLWKD